MSVINSLGDLRGIAPLSEVENWPNSCVCRALDTLTNKPSRQPNLSSKLNSVPDLVWFVYANLDCKFRLSTVQNFLGYFGVDDCRNHQKRANAIGKAWVTATKRDSDECWVTRIFERCESTTKCEPDVVWLFCMVISSLLRPPDSLHCSLTHSCMDLK